MPQLDNCLDKGTSHYHANPVDADCRAQTDTSPLALAQRYFQRK